MCLQQVSILRGIYTHTLQLLPTVLDGIPYHRSLPRLAGFRTIGDIDVSEDAFVYLLFVWSQSVITGTTLTQRRCSRQSLGSRLRREILGYFPGMAMLYGTAPRAGYFGRLTARGAEREEGGGQLRFGGISRLSGVWSGTLKSEGRGWMSTIGAEMVCPRALKSLYFYVFNGCERAPGFFCYLSAML